MMIKQLICIAIALAMANVASAVVISDTQTWDYKMSISGDTLEIAPTGNLTVDAPERHELVNAATLNINGGTMTIIGARLRCENDSTIIMNGGLLDGLGLDDGVKLPDDDGPSNLILNGGLMDVSYIQPFADRGASIIVGGGVLRIQDDEGGGGPNDWIGEGFVHLADGFTELVVTDLGGGAWELAAIPEPATISLLGLGGLALIRRNR
jgi:hypothetical protein